MARPVWTATERARERILVFGGEGVGKTKAALDIARRMVGTGRTMYVLDADNAWERMAPEDLIRAEHHRDGSVVEFNPDAPLVIYHVKGWLAQKAAFQVLDQVGRDDWFVIDSISKPWDDILKWYIKKVHGDDLPDFLLEHRIQQAKDDKRATQGQDATLVEWNFINPLWHKVVTEPLVWAGCHVLVTAEAGELRTDGRDSKMVKRLYEQVGNKPRTQKGLGHGVSTVLYLEKTGLGEYRMSTVKDREDARGAREGFARDEWSDFFVDYLKGVAGWGLKKVNDEGGEA